MDFDDLDAVLELVVLSEEVLVLDRSLSLVVVVVVFEVSRGCVSSTTARLEVYIEGTTGTGLNNELCW